MRQNKNILVFAFNNRLRYSREWASQSLPKISQQLGQKIRILSTHRFKKTIAHYRQLQSEDKYAHIAAEKKQSILDQCAQAEGWLESKKAEQAALPKHQDPVFCYVFSNSELERILF